MMIQCDQCGARYKIDMTKISGNGNRVRCARCKHIFPVRLPGTCILIAKDSKDFHLSVKELLQDQPFDLLFALDGVEALDKIQKCGPALVVLDVALPKIYGFELAEMLKSNPLTKETRIILLAAIHDKTRYKRRPESLYGADDYIEAHHISDKLLPMIRGLLPDLFPRPPEPRQQMKQAPPIEDTAQEETLSQEMQQKASRLARIIVSDIALYNQGKVEEGIREGDFEQRLAPELQEAEEMMKRRFPELPLDECKKLIHKEINALVHKDSVARSV